MTGTVVVGPAHHIDEPGTTDRLPLGGQVADHVGQRGGDEDGDPVAVVIVIEKGTATGCKQSHSQ